MTERETIDRIMTKAGLFNIMFINEFLDWSICNLGAALKKTKFFRHRTKYAYNNYVKEKKHYNNQISLVMKEKLEVFQEQADLFAAEIKPYYDETLQVMKDEFAHAIPQEDMDIISQVFLVQNLFALARDNYYDWYKFFKSKSSIIVGYEGIRTIDITDRYNKYQMLLLELVKDYHIKPFDFDEEKIDNVWQKFVSRAASVHLTLTCMQKINNSPCSVRIDIVPDRPEHYEMPQCYKLNEKKII